jgi:hypothetical protein
MNRVSRRQFLIAALGFTGTLALPRAIPIATAIGRPPRMVRPPRAYGVRGYGHGAYGSTEVSAPAEGIFEASPADPTTKLPSQQTN